MLSGGLPSFVLPEYDEELGITHCVTPETLAAALGATPDARAAFVVSPTYYGMAADIAGLAEVAHEYGVPLVVDQAWGPHFGFHDALPPPALEQGADAMLTSTHKIAGSLTQSAMLHVGLSGRIDPEGMARALRLLRSTSPSSLLLLSLDGARRQLALHGEQLLHEVLEAIAVARAKLETIEGIRLVDSSWVGRSGIAAYDPMRIVIDVRGTGCTGYEVADALRRSYDVHVELPTQATIVLVVGLADSAPALRRLAGDIEETVKRIAKPGTTAAITVPARMLLGEMVVSPPGRVPRRGRGRARGRRRRPNLVRVDRELPAGRAPAAPRRADLGRDRRPPHRAGARPARDSTARPTLGSARSTFCARRVRRRPHRFRRSIDGAPIDSADRFRSTSHSRRRARRVCR